MSAATATLPNGNGIAANGHAETKKSSAKSRGALKRLKAKAKAARAGTESEAETDKESDTEVRRGFFLELSYELTLYSLSHRPHQ
jgi:hypothetical protein